MKVKRKKNREYMTKISNRKQIFNKKEMLRSQLIREKIAYLELTKNSLVILARYISQRVRR